jgi:hypothetical protein
MNETARALTGSSDGLPLLRAPLQLALLISPIYLLFPLPLYKRSFNRQLMLSIGEALGNRKPALIVEVEKAIWRVVFALVEGPLLNFFVSYAKICRGIELLLQKTLIGLILVRDVSIQFK